MASFMREHRLGLLCVAAVWALSFLTPPRTPLDDVPFIDKWTHVAMYGGTCAVLWWECLRGRARAGLPWILLVAWLVPVLMGGLIEVLQENCTGGRRHGDVLDFLANSVGATLAALIGIPLAIRRARRGRGRR